MPLALDFDGVICDSVRETAGSGWRALKQIWDDVPDSPPAGYEEKFRQLRPVLETGYESLIMARLIQENYDIASVLQDYPACRDALMRQYTLTPEQLIPLFAEVRDHWIRTDPDGWLDQHGFYPEATAAVQAALDRGVAVFIITTKQTRFTEALLKRAGLNLPEGHLFGLEAGPKTGVLRRLIEDAPPSAGACVFMEDRIKTLLRVAADPVLAPVHLWFADWGYHTEDELGQAREQDRIRVFAQSEFARVAAVGETGDLRFR